MTSPTHDLAFFKGFLARPWKVASPVPSGRKLARKIAEQIDPEPGGFVLELGPGTGAVTRAIRELGIAEGDLVLIESDPEFVALLRAEFPRARVVAGDAFAFPEVLGEDARGLCGIVSGLPVMGEPLERRRRFLQSAMDALGAGEPFVQFSYSSRPPLPCIDGVDMQHAAMVWQNLIPMHIWVYRRSEKKLSAERRGCRAGAGAAGPWLPCADRRAYQTAVCAALWALGRRNEAERDTLTTSC